MKKSLILNGRDIAANIRQQIAAQIATYQINQQRTPGLAVILVGSNPASKMYIKNKRHACDEVGIISTCHQLPETVEQTALEALIQSLNEDPTVDGILLQLPLPKHLETDDLLEKIDPKKDVDGFHPYNLGRLAQKRPLLRPCTPYGVMTLLKETGEKLAGKHAVIVGASNIVGRPMALELLLEKCTVTVCHRDTQNLKQHIESADIIISATGHVGVIKSDWIKSGAIVIDVGFSRLSNGTISGDIEFDSAATRAGWITPVPGGVGPMTVATLLQNTMLAYKLALAD